MPAVLLLLCLAIGCSKSPREYVFAGETMGTTYTVKVATVISSRGEAEFAEAISAALERINALMSTYRPDSELSRFNRHASTDPFPLSPETAEVFRIALEVSRQTNGAFDVTVGPLVNAWGFGPEEGQAPGEDRLAELRQRVGFHFLALDAQDRISKKHVYVYCDLSAIAKGYAVDHVAAMLEDSGIDHYMVEVGGEVRAKGRKASGEAWRIGIERPVVGQRGLMHVVRLADKALATSGDYRNFYVRDGVRLSHTIDPATGRPVAHSLASASVMHDACAWADAYATALMVLGPEKGYDFAVSHGLAVLLVNHGDTDFEKQMTPPFAACLEK